MNEQLYYGNLKNDMGYLLIKNKYANTATVMFTVRVGSRNENTSTNQPNFISIFSMHNDNS